MKKRAEITWSLMHPTPLDVEYVKLVVERSAGYPVDSFEICAECHSNLGGMDGLADYSCFPETGRRIDREGIAANRRKLREIIALAHSVNKPVYYWHREAMVPEGLLTDMPDLLDANGEFDLLGPAYEKLLRYKIAASFEAVPELDGLVLTLTEASYSVIHNSNTEKFPPVKVVEHLVRIFAEELSARNKRFILRSFGSIAKDYEDIIAGAAEVLKDHRFEIETKITPYDFDPFLPVNPFLRKVPGATLGAECDGLGEFLGAGALPAENIENIVNYVRRGRAAGVDRYAIRLDRVGNRLFDSYEMNLYAYSRAIEDENVTAESVRREFLAAHAPAGQRKIFAELSVMGLDFIRKNNFIDGNVIFHQFPPAKSLKYLKAGFIFALFKNDVPLANGSGVWSILSENSSPGRSAVMAEKREAVAIADEGCRLLETLAPVPGFEKELEWRRKLWKNAAVASRAFYALCRAVCAYFDDMESGDSAGRSLRAAVEQGRRELSEAAGADLSGEAAEKAAFVNGLEQHLFRRAGDARDIYLDPLYAILGLLEEEYDIEYAMRRKYGEGAADCIICGAITDEWRVRRYMHAGHSSVRGGEIFRCAGNTVFPNGFLEMELAVPVNGGKLEIFGDTSETKDFVLTLDGVRRELSLDGEGKVSLDIPAGASRAAVRIEKAPGALYPAVRAVRVTA